jgi:hypothetical protein
MTTDRTILDEYLISRGLTIYIGSQVDFAGLAAVRASIVVIVVHEVKAAALI